MLQVEEKQDRGQNVSKFDWICSGSDRAETAFYDRPLFETERFVVLPSLGSIVPGWLLIVPKIRAARFSELPAEMSSELSELLTRLADHTRSRFGRPYLFEHGGYEASKVSCGVDQAHLHLVPLKFDLLACAREDSSQTWRSCESTLRVPFDRTIGEYLFVSSLDAALVAEVKKPVSQWFRRMIAQKSGEASKWDYKQYAYFDNVQLTIKAVSGHV